MQTTERYNDAVLQRLGELRGDGLRWSAIAERLSTEFYPHQYTGNQVRQASKTHDVLVAKLAPAAAASQAKPKQNNLLAYIATGRTAKQIAKHTGCLVDEVPALMESLESDDHFVSAQRDAWGERTYILLPRFTDELVIKPRAWDCALDTKEDVDWRDALGCEDWYQALASPYMVAQFKNKGERIKIIPLFDVHYGHHAHRAEKFRSTIGYIRDTENVYAFTGGDLIENALDDGRGMSYEQAIQPENQITGMLKMLAPVAHKLLFLHPGNHEDRTYKRSGFDPTLHIASRLQVPFFSHPMRARMVWGEHDWGMNVFHGRGNAQTPGGKMSRAAKPREFYDFVEYIVSGHTHEALTQPHTCIVEDRRMRTLTHKSQYVIVAQSYLDYWFTYAHKANYPPPSLGGIGMHIYEDGRYDATMKPEH